MRTVSGALRPPNINWVPVLSNIEPPQIRRDCATLQEYEKAQQLTDGVPIKEILREPPKSRLRYRRPFVAEAARLASLNQTEQQTWEQSWYLCNTSPQTNLHIIVLHHGSVSKAHISMKNNVFWYRFFAYRYLRLYRHQRLRRRYTIRFARTEPADCPVHGSIVTCDMSLECPGHLKIG